LEGRQRALIGTPLRPRLLVSDGLLGAFAPVVAGDAEREAEHARPGGGSRWQFRPEC
jgi:hypothetical protein